MKLDLGKLFVGGISWDTNEDRLREYFEIFGEVVEAVIMKDRTTGRARGFGFVVFADGTVAVRVVMEKHLIDGRMVEAKRAVPRDDQHLVNRNSSSDRGSPGLTRTRKIFVGGLASTVTEADFRTYFEQFGTISDVAVMYDHNTRRPRGFGFITYESEDSVHKVLLKTFHELNNNMVEVKRAVPKELSPGPIMRSPMGGYNYDMNRINSSLSDYMQGYIPSSVGGYGMRVDGRFGPLASGRNGFPSLNPGNGMGLNFDTGMNPGYGGSSSFNSSLGYVRAKSPYYNRNSSRFSSPIGHGGGNGIPGSVFSSPAPNVWSNDGLNYTTNYANSYSNLALGDTTFREFPISAQNWGGSSPPISAQGVGSGSRNASGSLGYGTSGNILDLGTTTYGRNSGVAGSLNNSFTSLSNGYEGYRGNSIYGDPTWRSASSDLEHSSLFGYGLGSTASDGTAEKSLGHIAGYNVMNRQTNRGMCVTPRSQNTAEWERDRGQQRIYGRIIPTAVR